MVVRGKIQLRDYGTGILSKEGVKREARIAIGALTVMETVERERRIERRKEERGEMGRKASLAKGELFF